MSSVTLGTRLAEASRQLQAAEAKRSSNPRGGGAGNRPSGGQKRR
mgnify:CR=1 FL=1